MERNPNETAEMRYRKFPVNWMPEDFQAMLKIAKVEYDGCLAQYIRRTVRRDLRERGLIGPDAQIELFPEYTPIQVEKRKIGVKWVKRPAHEYADPPRRFMGFAAGLYRNPFVMSWFRKKRGAYLENNT